MTPKGLPKSMNSARSSVTEVDLRIRKIEKSNPGEDRALKRLLKVQTVKILNQKLKFTVLKKVEILNVLSRIRNHLTLILSQPRNQKQSPVLKLKKVPKIVKRLQRKRKEIRR